MRTPRALGAAIEEVDEDGVDLSAHDDDDAFVERSPTSPLRCK